MYITQKCLNVAVEKYIVTLPEKYNWRFNISLLLGGLQNMVSLKCIIF